MGDHFQPTTMLTILSLALLLLSANCKPLPQQQICSNKAKCIQNIKIDNHYYGDGEGPENTNYNYPCAVVNGHLVCGKNNTSSSSSNSYNYYYEYYEYYDYYEYSS